MEIKVIACIILSLLLIVTSISKENLKNLYKIILQKKLQINNIYFSFIKHILII